MIEITFVISLFLLLILVLCYLQYGFKKIWSYFSLLHKNILEKEKEEKLDISPFLENIESLSHRLSIFENNSAKALSVLAQAIKETPVKTLNTIQGSVNTTTGKLGEMIQLIELQQAYDRVIVVGDIVDFICINFGEGDNEAVVDFIDVKTGKKAVLNTDQKKLRDLITLNPSCVKFKTVKVHIT